jgi:D-amino-acid dehydrogenase
MHVLILGSGVIGTCIAYYLARDGHSVTVVDRQPAAGLETSFANAGEISPGFASPWAGPGVPLKAIKWLMMEHRPLVIRPGLDPALVVWLAQMLRNCTSGRYVVNKTRMVRLSEYSRDCLKALRGELPLAYDARTKGTLQLFRTQAQLDAAGKDAAVLQAEGVPFELYDGDGYLAHEPGLEAVRHKFRGALRLPGDETGDCFMFTQALAAEAARLGVEFRYGTTIEGIDAAGGRVGAVRTSAGALRADRIVVATGSHAPALLRPLGIRLPVYPVKGYSITVPITHNDRAPESTVMDESHKVAVTRLGDRIRVGGTAQLSGFDLSLTPERRRTLEFVVQDLFPEGGDVTRASFWTGLRPMTPDGTPVLGPTKLDNLYLACGHGTLGWTMAAGTGRVMADLLAGRPPEIDMNGLTLARYA